MLAASLLAGCSRMSLPVDFDWADITPNRSAWDRLHVLAGDSLWRGYAIGTFADLATPETPLYKFRSVQAIANWALEQSAISDRFVYMWPIFNHGNINPEDIRGYIRAGVIRSSDSIIYEDAGTHSMNPEQYQTFWEAARAAASDTLPVTSVMMDMFDFPHGANIATNPNCQYETPFNGRTMNDATRAAAMTPRQYPGQTLLLPMRQIATDLRNEMLSEYALDPADGDGVHMRVWLQIKVAGVLCKAVGARVRNVQPLIDYAVANLEALKYGSPNFDAEAAEFYVRDAFMSEPYAMLTTERRGVLKTEDNKALLSEFRR
jgi:hypothetical protein